MSLITAVSLLLGVSQAVVSPGRVFQFNYDSHLYGRLGYFRVTEESLLTKSESAPLSGPYMLNDYIIDLHFQFKGATWTKEDVSIGPQEAHAFSWRNSLPVVSSGNGALARNHFGSITMYHPSVGVRFRTEYVLGNWVTTVVVPEPTSLMLAIPLAAFLAKRWRIT